MNKYVVEVTHKNPQEGNSKMAIFEVVNNNFYDIDQKIEGFIKENKINVLSCKIKEVKDNGGQ